MPDRNEVARLVQALRVQQEAVDRANNSYSNETYQEAMAYSATGDQRVFDDEELIRAQLGFQYALKKYEEMVLHVLGVLQERERRAELTASLNAQKIEISGYFRCSYEPIFDFMHCPAEDQLDRLVDSLHTLYSNIVVVSDEPYERLVAILKNYGAMVLESKEVISSENEMRRKLNAHLKSFFSDDLIPTPTFESAGSNRKADAGLSSSKVAIEYKYVVNRADLERAVNEVHADSVEYQGNSNWDRYIAFFYMTEPYEAEHRLAARIRRECGNNWLAVAVVGPSRTTIVAPADA